MSIVSIKQLLEAGVHFGHHTRRWNPKMAEYIFTERNGVYIIDLQKTIKKFEEAYMFVRQTVEEGGMLTNYRTIRTSIERLRSLEKMKEDGVFDMLPKKEVAALIKEMDNLNKNLGGIKNMKGLPAAVFIVDPRKEHNAVLECKKLGIPVVAIVDTNCDPDDADYVIPGNDDAIRGIRLITSVIADAVIEGKQGEQLAEAEAEITAAEAEEDAE